MVGVIARNKILHNGAGLEQANALAITESVGQGGDAAIGVDGKEPRLFLGVLADFDLLDLVGQAYRASAEPWQRILHEQIVPKLF